MHILTHGVKPIQASVVVR
ncbi:unnamed protein product [Oikopleura dioica]|uniref:Uncharacterized protein n=1 Tax=Oikopleura dioica TaxID=34765 RepID=E4YFF6_OIKDI|nr:unnamed protein product [Oikopleura dioica]